MGGNAGGRSSTSLAPGFRFHPTDEELVSYYLKRKVCGKPLRFDAISEIEIYKSEPWDLPGLSKLKTRDLEWYFFSNLDKKYGNGSKTNRATTEGYWKTTGKDRPVHHRSRIVGMKKTLVYHRGRAPRGERTNWVMHEYRLVDEGSEKAGNACMLLEQESFVLCRIFQKSGTGPKNGEKYGAPFVEEEWEDDSKVATLPIEPVADEFLISDDSFAEGNDLDQDPAFEFLLDYPTSLNPHHDGGGNVVENLAETGYNLPTMVNEGQVAMETNDDQKLFDLPTMANEGQVAVETNDDQKFFNLPVQLEADAVKSEYPAQPTDVMSHVPLALASEHRFDNVNSAPSDEAYFLEANDLLEPIEGNTSEFKMLDEYITYFEADDDIGQYLTFDTPDILGADGALSDQALTDQNLDQSNEQASTSNQQLPELHSAESASTSKHVTVKSEPDSKYPFMKQASGMLGNFTGPSTFASEFPTKDMAARLHAAAQSSDPVRVTAGMIRITDHSSANEDVVQWSLDKSGNINVVLSFSLPEGLVSPAGVEAVTDVISRKMTSAISRGWLCFFIFSVTLLCISAKVGASICAK